MTVGLILIRMENKDDLQKEFSYFITLKTTFFIRDPSVCYSIRLKGAGSTERNAVVKVAW